MLRIEADRYTTCDGLSRRSFLQVGALAVGGLTLGNLLRARADQVAAGKQTRDTSVILIWKGGGPSHIDTWDLKPNAPAEYRGEFKPIDTNIPGIQVSEHLPMSARQMDKFSILRSVTHPDAGHESASHFLLTGYKPTNDIPAQEMPSYGSIVAKQCGARQAGLPAYIAVPRAPRSSAAGYLGVAYNPFAVGSDPNDANFSVRNLTLPNGLPLARMEGRKKLLESLDGFHRDADRTGLMDGLDAFTHKAFDMITSPAAQRAFDMNREADKSRERYGRTSMGQSMLLARRLIEAGVTFVTVDAGGWDTHANNFEELKKRKLPQFDQAYSALLEDLSDRGQLANTLVMVLGEFGRTPRVNKDAGRDHWPGALSVLMAGGGLKGGQAIGVSDARGEYPKERPLSPEDVLSTMYYTLGVDQNVEFMNEAQRPLKILNSGEPIRELVG
jgi:hypothetical protein